jgi:hypothetical protein
MIATTGPFTIYGIAVDANNVYWAEYATSPPGRIAKAPKAGGATAALAQGENGPVDVRTDGTNVYYTTYDGGEVKKVPVDGSAAATKLFSLAGSYPQEQFLGGGHLYWTAWNGTVKRVDLDGKNEITIASSQGMPFGIVVDGGTVFWLARNGGRLQTAPDADSAMTLAIASNLKGGSEIAVDASSVYASTLGDGRVVKVPRAGGDVVELYTGGGEIERLIASGDFVYFRDNKAGMIWRVAKSGGTALTLASGLTGNSGITADDTGVYFASNRQILRVAK